MPLSIDTPIRLHRPEARAGDPRRLNLFAGLALDERRFERLQAYADDRIEPLLAALGPGIVHGLELRTDGAGRDLVLHVQPGLGVAGSGALVRLADALTQRWPDLAAQAVRDLDRPLTDGLYRLTLRHGVEAIDADVADEAATRTEPDPLREAYLESVTLLGLTPADASPRWLGWPRERAANRVLARHVTRPPYEADDATLSIGLVKVVGGLPAWVDMLAGRWLAGPDSGARALLAHTRQVLAARQAQWQIIESQPGGSLPIAPLNSLLGLDHLPAAVPLPARLLPQPAAARPVLAFQPADLRIDLVPVPASAISGVIESELPRGTVSLTPGARERVRLLLAVADADYRPDLLDLPARERALEDRLFRLGQAARTAYNAWRQSWQRLYRGGTAAGLKELGAPAFIEVAPPDPADVRTRLRDRRAARSAGQPLPEPYASHDSAPHPPPDDYRPVPIADATGTSLLVRLEAERRAIADLEGVLEESFRLLNEVNDYLGLQRQHFDVISASFSSLGGGVPGDGSGAKSVRWVSQLKYTAGA